MTESNNSKPYDQQLAGFLISPFKNTALHPNHITTVTLVLGQTASWIFALAIDSLAWLAALLYMLAVFTDHMDGELARMSGKTSTFGHTYDYIVGGVNYTTLFIGIGIGLQSFGIWTVILGFVAGLSNPLILFLRMNMEKIYGHKAVKHPRFARFEDEDFIYLIGPIIWFAGILWFFVPYALGNVGYLIWTVKEHFDWKQRNAS